MNDSASTMASGILDVNSKGFGFLRQKNGYYAESEDDHYVSPELIRKLGLKTGLFLEGEEDYGKTGKRILKEVLRANGKPAAEWRRMQAFHTLTTISPDQRLRLETKGGPVSTRIIDLLSPIGKGSRSLIVAPPKTGKTTLLKDLAQAVTKNHPEIKLYALLIDERPEEVTDMRRSIQGEVLASSMDMAMGNHVRLTRLASEMVKRKIEMGEDVLLILDSITRVSRAFNNYEGTSGRTLSGGLDSRAMEFPRSFFGSARNIEQGGSLTIIATALVDTGSRMDELIFQEFQGTGNQEIILNRRTADKRIWPAIDIIKSRTRRDELLLSANELEGATRIRRGLSGLSPENAMERLLETIQKYETNEDFIKVLLSTKLPRTESFRED
jgi:transcription termination factor Rho